jgi:CHAT domain-containing protein
VSRRRHLLAVGAACLLACGPPDDATRSAPTHATTSAAPALPSGPDALARLLGASADSLHAAAEQRYGRGAYDSALAIWRVELARARRAPDGPAEARTRMGLGLAAWRLGDYAAARREGEASLALKRSLGLDAELSRSFNALGLLAWNEGRHHDALRAFDSAMATARRHGDRPAIARAAANVPLVQVELGDFDGARRSLERARAEGHAVADDRLEGNALANLAMLEIRLGQSAKAIPLLASARTHYDAIDYATGQANALGQLATAWSALGDLQRAIASVDSALAIARRHGLEQEIASELEVVADLYEQAGEHRLALARLSEADSLDAALGLAVERGTNDRRVSAILLELGQVDGAVERARQAVARHRAADARTEVVYDRLQLARALATLGDVRAASIQTDSARGVARRSQNPAAMRESALVAGRVAIDAGVPERALRAIEEGERIDTESDWRLADLRAEVSLALGRLEEGRRAGERAVALLEGERASLDAGPLRSTYPPDRVAPFAHLVALHLASGDTARAFRVAAMLPGRTIAERYGAGRNSPSVGSSAEDEQLLVRAAALERQIAELGEGASTTEQRASLERALAATRTSYTERMARRDPQAGARPAPVAAADVRSVQAGLAVDEALLLYVSGPRRIDLFVVRRDALLHRSVPLDARALAARVRLALARVGGAASPEGSGARAMLEQLHELLMKPALATGALEGVTQLVVVPHGPLTALPFAALRDPATKRFLVEDRVVRVQPSVTPLPRRDAARALTTVELFAPTPKELPGTATEVRSIARLVPAAHLHVGSASSERLVRAALVAGRAVHIASHGEYGAQNPLFGRIAVGAPAGRNDVANDGWLEAHEVLSLHTSSPLVFLSGCETALAAGTGPFVRDVDDGSLAESFLAAGAATVVATLWRVGDNEASEIAVEFYRAIARGAASARALALAQRAVLRRHPASLGWAAYTIAGPASANPARVSVTSSPNP